jgi:diguanylate cyclase (GGDEF)-like protein
VRHCIEQSSSVRGGEAKLSRRDHRPRKRPDDASGGGANGQVAAVRDEDQLARDEESLDVEQTASDADQTISDADQTASDSDQAASDRNQAQAEADQRASDRDQAAADRERGAGPAVGETNHETSRVDRLRSTLERGETASARARTATERLERAARRDENARLRDLSAAARDRAAEERDLASASVERELGLFHPASEAAREHAAAVRLHAAADRARAAADRERAAADRLAAARDRDHARAELRRAQVDELTGAFGRELGMVALEREINRAQHEDGRLVLAFVDVDGLKEVNDRQGHAAGDALLRDVVGAIQMHLRSYDPIVRVGGDEFVCALAGTGLDEARRRFDEIRELVEETQPAASISVGYAALRPKETLDDLTARGDTALYEAKHAR